VANTITGLTTSAYKALDVVSRELVGMIPAVTLDADVAAAALNQSVRSHVVPVSEALADATPAMSFPSASDQTIANVEIKITKSKTADFSWNAEEQRGLNHRGAGYLSINENQIAQAMRRLTNAVETDLAALYTTFSRSIGTAGTAPFASAGDYTNASLTLKILKDNGAPQSDNHLVMNTAAGANILGKQADVNRQGSDSILRQGILLDTSGMALRESGQIKTTTKGTGTNYTSHADGFAAGITTIELITGSGTVVAGDTITFANDTNKYIVTTGLAAPGDVVIAEPGLRQALPASAVAMTIGADAAQNLCFSRSAIILATRMPAVPAEGDLAISREVVTDPRSGLSFEISVWPGTRMVLYQVGLAWGVKNIKPEHTAVLLG
jgi:hypothetical protein